MHSFNSQRKDEANTIQGCYLNKDDIKFKEIKTLTLVNNDSCNRRGSTVCNSD